MSVKKQYLRQIDNSNRFLKAAVNKLEKLQFSFEKDTKKEKLCSILRRLKRKNYIFL